MEAFMIDIIILLVFLTVVVGLPMLLLGRRKEDTVFCYTCDHVVLKDTAQRLTATENYPYSFKMTDIYFCIEHTKKYERVEARSDTDIRFYSKFRVDEDGTPIGYKKVKNKRKK